MISRCGVVRRVDVEKWIERLVRPGRERDAVPGGPDLDLAQTLDRERVAQIIAQVDAPQPDHRMTPIAGLRARDPEKARAAIQNDIIEGGPLIEAVLRSQATAAQPSDA